MSESYMKLSAEGDSRMRYLLLIYELCKAGVIRFDFTDEGHRGLFAEMVNRMKSDIYCERDGGVAEQAARSARSAAYAAILCQILVHRVPGR